MATKRANGGGRDLKVVPVRMPISTWRKLQKLALTMSNQMEQRVSMNSVLVQLIEKEARSAPAPKARKS